ncbi:MAG: glycosyl hydrolase family 95 catalytic domain-containing protein [Promethearchaeota archaeon]
MDLKSHELLYEKPPVKWLDGIFLGNGDAGAMIWGDGSPLKVTLDKMDFWEERFAPEWKFGPEHNWQDIKKLVLQGDQASLRKKYEFYLGKNRNGGMPLQPTRLPAPRMEINLGTRFNKWKVSLNIADGVVSGVLQDHAGHEILMRCVLHSEQNVLLLDFKNVKKNVNEADDAEYSGLGLMLENIKIKVSNDHLNDEARISLESWGYPPLSFKKDADLKPSQWEKGRAGISMSHVFQEIPDGQGGLMVAWSLSKIDEWIRITCVILSKNNLDEVTSIDKNLKRDNDYISRESSTSLEGALASLSRSLLKKYSILSWEDLYSEHRVFWDDYWKKLMVSIPDNIIENLYYIELYKFACNSRRGKYPCSLQGIWTIDGVMPPWKGDYHLDMNIQEAYWLAYSNNRLELLEPLFRTMSSLIPSFNKRCKEFYGIDAIWTSCSISLHGENLHGYYNTEVWPGNGSWLAHMYWLYWLYSCDVQFLAEQAWPMLKGTGKLYMSLLEKNEFGEYYVPLSCSPEYLENKIEAWGTNPTSDISLIKWNLEAIISTWKILKESQYKELLKKEDDELATRASEILKDLVFFPADMEGFQVMEGRPYSYPHRHMTHLFPIHPFHQVSVEGDDDEKYLVRSSLKKLRKIGNWEWSGWTFPWLSMMASWANNKWLAYKYLKDYMLFINENTMHVNGDPRNLGICAFIYDPMTLEAGFCFAAAIPELLMKSWGGIIRIFESTPKSWKDACFTGLLAEGGFEVSASMREGKIEWVLIKSLVGSKLKFKNHHGINLRIYNASTGDILGEIPPSEDVFEILTRKNQEYAVIPAGEKFERKKLKFRQVKPMFNGEHWFGLQENNRNPYLP